MRLEETVLKSLEEDRKVLKMILDSNYNSDNLSIILKNLLKNKKVCPCIHTVYKGQATTVPIDQFVEEIKSPTKKNNYNFFKNESFQSIEGTLKYILLHEIGESLKVKQIMLLTNNKPIKFKDLADLAYQVLVPVNFSGIFPTDVYGDFLGSAFSPLNAETQLGLFSQVEQECQKSKNLQKFYTLDPKVGILLEKDQGYVNFQISVFAENIIRKRTQIFQGVKKMVKSCVGLNDKERLEAYLKFYDKDINSVLKNLEANNPQYYAEEFVNQNFFDTLKEEE